MCFSISTIPFLLEETAFYRIASLLDEKREYILDLYYLMKRAVAMRKHIEKNNRDKDSKYRLILVESKIHRQVRYYKLTKQIPANWKYDYQTALALVS